MPLEPLFKERVEGRRNSNRMMSYCSVFLEVPAVEISFNGINLSWLRSIFQLKSFLNLNKDLSYI